MVMALKRSMLQMSTMTYMDVVAGFINNDKINWYKNDGSATVFLAILLLALIMFFLFM